MQLFILLLSTVCIVKNSIDVGGILPLLFLTSNLIPYIWFRSCELFNNTVPYDPMPT